MRAPATRVASVEGGHLADRPAAREDEFVPMVEADVQRTFDDIDRIRELVGYEPETLFRQGMREFVAWYRRVER